MADIKISNLSGSDLFNDAESFMSEINNEATESIVGGDLCQGTVVCQQNTAYCPQGTVCGVTNQPGCGYRTYFW